MQRGFKRLSVFALILFYTHQIGVAQVTKLDSLKQILETNELADSSRVYLLIELCEASTFTDEMGGKPYAEKALAISKNAGFQTGVALANNSLGAYYLQVGNLPTALAYILEAEQIYRQLGGQEERLLAVYNNLGIVYNRSGEWNKAIEVYKNALRLAESDQNYLQQAMLYNNMGSAYDNLQNYDSAILAFEKVDQISRLADLELGIMMAQSNLGSVYHTKGRYLEAKQAYDDALIIAEAGSYSRNIATIRIGLGDAHFGLGNEDLAQQYFRDGIALATELAALPLLEDGYAGLAKLYESQGNWSEALASYKNWQMTRDSLFSIEKSQLVEELKTRYETEKRENEILSLSQENQIKTLQLKQKNQLLGLVGLGALVIFGFGLVFFQKKKWKEEAKSAELEQRFLRSQLNPHFIFNALASVQNFMLRSESQKASYYLGKFAKLIRQVLENSRTEFIPLAEEIRMLENYLLLEQLLHEKKFEFEISHDPMLDPEDISIPPMFVQPFVENAIKHGLQPGKEGWIRVRFTQQEKFILIEVSDNGQGMLISPGKSAHQSLATAIIRERIENYNQKLRADNRLQVRSSADHDGIAGTLIQLMVPYTLN